MLLALWKKIVKLCYGTSQLENQSEKRTQNKISEQSVTLGFEVNLRTRDEFQKGWLWLGKKIQF